MTRSRRLLALAVLIAVSPTAVGAGDFLAENPRVADAFTLLDLWIGEHMRYHQIPGLAIGVVHDHELIWSKGYGVSDLDQHTPMTTHTLFRMGSVTKVFTATAIMQLRDAGKLRLDDPITRHLPGFRIQSPFAEAPAITIWNLLTHTGGLPREAAVPYWTDHEFPNRDELLAAAATQTQLFTPGTRYHYSNLGTSLLGAIIEQASGQTYPQYLTEHILEPLEMTSSLVDPPAGSVDRLATAYMRRQPDGSRDAMEYYETRGMAAMGSLVSSVEDMARFAALHLRAGNSTAAGAVLATSTMREMHRPQWVYPSWSGAMGLGFRIAPGDGRNTVSHSGWIGDHQSHLLLVPDEGIGVIVMVNAGDISPSPFSSEALALVSATLATGSGTATIAAPVEPTWQRYVGLYSDPWGWESTVLILGGQLAIYAHDYPPADSAEAGLTRLEHLEGDTFQLEHGELLTFELDDNGEVERLKDRTNYLFPVQ